MSDQEKTSGMGAEQEKSHFEETEHKDGMDVWWEKRNIPQKVATVFGFIILGVGLLFLFGFLLFLLFQFFKTFFLFIVGTLGQDYPPLRCVCVAQVDDEPRPMDGVRYHNSSISVFSRHWRLKGLWRHRPH